MYEICAVLTLLLILGSIVGLAFMLSGSVTVAGIAGLIAVVFYMLALFNFRG